MGKPKKYRNKKVVEKQKEFGRKPIYDAYYKTRKTVESCKTTKQLDSAFNMVKQFDELYGEHDQLYEEYKMTRSLLNTMSDKAMKVLRSEEFLTIMRQKKSICG